MRRLQIVALVISVAIATACQISWGLVVVNETRAAAVVAVTTRLDRNGGCVEAPAVVLVQSSLIGRVLSTRDLGSVEAGQLEPCGARVVLQAGSAVEFAYDSMAGQTYIEDPSGFVVRIEGEAGLFEISGRKIAVPFEDELVPTFPVFRYRR